MKAFIKKSFKKLGLEVSKFPQLMDVKGKAYDSSLTTLGALSRCRERGIKFNSVIDVGASDGRWSVECSSFFPNANYLMIEAQKEHQNLLQKVVERKSNFDYTIAAGGDETGKIYFDANDLFGGVASKEPAEGYVEVTMTTIDVEVKNRNLQPPYLIKLDTHGFEIPILKGASETLKQSNLVIIECYNYRIAVDSLKYFEMCDYMDKKGFSSIEMVDLMLRKHDASLWQMDIFFIPSSSREFIYNSYE